MAEPMFEFQRSAEEGFVFRFRPPRIVPEPTRQHVRNAQKELLLALRSCLDAAIEYMEEAGKPRQQRPRRKIEVE